MKVIQVFVIIVLIGIILKLFTADANATQFVTIPVDLPEMEVSHPVSNWFMERPVTEEDVECLALNIYFEARNDTVESQYTTSDVVMFRVMHSDFPDTICGVVKDGNYPSWNKVVPKKYECAFSWMCDRKSDIPTDDKAWRVAKFIANDVVNNPNYISSIDYALFYHARYVNPYWAATKVFVGKVGLHLYYI